MRTDELRDLPNEELLIRLEESKEELFNLRFQLATGQLENYKRVGGVRRDIARIETVVRERQLGIEPEPEVLEARKRSLEDRVRKAEEEAAHEEDEIQEQPQSETAASAEVAETSAEEPEAPEAPEEETGARRRRFRRPPKGQSEIAKAKTKGPLTASEGEDERGGKSSDPRAEVEGHARATVPQGRPADSHSGAEPEREPDTDDRQERT